MDFVNRFVENECLKWSWSRNFIRDPCRRQKIFSISIYEWTTPDSSYNIWNPCQNQWSHWDRRNELELKNWLLHRHQRKIVIPAAIAFTPHNKSKRNGRSISNACGTHSLSLRVLPIVRLRGRQHRRHSASSELSVRVCVSVFCRSVLPAMTVSTDKISYTCCVCGQWWLCLCVVSFVYYTEKKN